MCICRGDIERRSFICRVFAAQWWNAAADGLELAQGHCRRRTAVADSRTPAAVISRSVAATKASALPRTST
jgi:hypothetical protein